MISADFTPLANHLWQSTLCVALAWVLTLTLRKNRAAVRYWLWWLASVKFLIPFSLLVEFGRRFGWQSHLPAPELSFLPQISYLMGAASAPALRQTAAPHSPGVLPAILAGVWLCGVTVRLVLWLGWSLRIRAVQRAATPLDLDLPIPALASPARLEPGVFGIRKPVLLLPQGIAERLTAAQLNAVGAHEMCHIRRRDNLTAAIHMVVETIFWFHPLVWWISLRLVDERERACDEQVCSQGCEPQVYAAAILDVCKFYLDLPRLCAAGVTGADLRKRVERIMSHRPAQQLHFGKKLFLTAAGLAAVAAPLAIGILNAPLSHAQPPASRPKFEVASIKSAGTDNHRHWFPAITGDRFTITNGTLKVLIGLAYDVHDSQISGGPNWSDSEKYDLQAKAGSALTAPRMRLMLQSLLAERFRLALHRETKEEQIYELVVAKGGPKLEAAAETKTPGHLRAGKGQLTGIEAPILWLTQFLSENLDRYVADKTGLNGTYNFTLQWTPDMGQLPQQNRMHCLRPTLRVHPSLRRCRNSSACNSSQRKARSKQSRSTTRKNPPQTRVITALRMNPAPRSLAPAVGIEQ